MTFATLTQHERFWLDVIRVASNDTDATLTPVLAQQLRRIFSQTANAAARTLEASDGR